MSVQRPTPFLETRSAADFREAFDKFDVDDSGFIEKGEVESLLNDVYKGEGPPVEAATFLQLFDANGDGKISLEEFEKNMPVPLRKTLDEVLANGWTFDDDKWAASMERHASDDAFDPSKA